MNDPGNRNNDQVGGTSSDDRNRGDYSPIGKDQDGNPDGSWWGSHNYPSSDPNNLGGTHHSLFGDGSRTSFETDRDGYYFPGSGHTDGKDSWDTPD